MDEVSQNTGGISTPMLDKRSYRVGKRLVRHFGSELQAEAWLNEPNAMLHGMTPAEHFGLRGESWFLESTCRWPIEDSQREQLSVGG